jgi:hypothetical protein
MCHKTANAALGRALLATALMQYCQYCLMTMVRMVTLRLMTVTPRVVHQLPLQLLLLSSRQSQPQAVASNVLALRAALPVCMQYHIRTPNTVIELKFSKMILYCNDSINKFHNI